MIDSCTHPRTQPWVAIPFDVKSDRDTRFGAVVRCTACGHGMMRDMPEPHEIAAHYDLPKYYTQTASHMAHVTPNLLQRVLIKLAWLCDRGAGPLPEFLTDHARPGGRMLDIGAGSGTLLTAMKSRGFDVSGVEPDDQARARAASQGITVVAGTAEDIPVELTAERFDLITMTHVLEHCRIPEVALANVAAMLTRDGVFYCEVPNCGSVYFETYAPISEMLDIPRHLQFFTKDSLVRICEAAGLEVVAERFSGFTRHFLPGWCAWENSIHDRLGARGIVPACGRRKYMRSLKLLAKSAVAPAARKYDSLGLLMRKRGV